MNLRRRFRAELAGAWRSLRYDLGRRPPVPDGNPRTGGPDVTYTGMSTFGVPITAGESVPKRARGTGPKRADQSVPIKADERPRRPLATVSLFVLLAVAGAAASYFAVANGLGSMLREKPAAPPRPYPMAAAPPETSNTSSTGLGRATGQAGTPSGTRTPSPATSPTTGKPAVSDQPDPPETSKPESGATPPVPTPTAPSAAPSATPSAQPSPEPSTEPSASDEPSPTPSEASTDGTRPSAEARVAHRHRPRY